MVPPWHHTTLIICSLMISDWSLFPRLINYRLLLPYSYSINLPAWKLQMACTPYDVYTIHHRHIIMSMLYIESNVRRKKPFGLQDACASLTGFCLVRFYLKKKLLNV